MLEGSCSRKKRRSGKRQRFQRLSRVLRHGFRGRSLRRPGTTAATGRLRQAGKSLNPPSPRTSRRLPATLQTSPSTAKGKPSWLRSTTDTRSARTVSGTTCTPSFSPPDGPNWSASTTPAISASQYRQCEESAQRERLLGRGLRHPAIFD